MFATLSSQSNEENTEGRRHMQEILSRLHEADANPIENLDSDDENDEEEEGDDLSSRLAGVSLDDADAVWQRLSSSERAEFEKLLQTGGITELLPEFSPWWEKKSKLVEEVELPDGSNSDLLKAESQTKVSIPDILKDIPNFKDLCKKPASPSLLFNTTNIVGAYVYTVRCFNGEHLDWASQAAYIAWNLSNSLNNNQNYDNMMDAITSVAINMTEKENSSEEELSTMKADAQCILSSPLHLQAGLSDLLSLYRAAVRHRPPTAKGPFSQRFPDGADNQIPRDKLKLSMKKLEFYLSWVLQEKIFIANKT